VLSLLADALAASPSHSLRAVGGELPNPVVIPVGTPKKMRKAGRRTQENEPPSLADLLPRATAAAAAMGVMGGGRQEPPTESEDGGGVTRP
jgi:hypothetical protein